MVDNTNANMTTNVTVGRGDARAGAVRRRTFTTDSIRSVVDGYVHYRSSLPIRRTPNDSRQSDVLVAEDQLDGPISHEDNHMTSNLPPGLEQAVRALTKEFEQRYEQASRHCHDHHCYLITAQ